MTTPLSNEPVLTVSQITQAIKLCLESTFLNLCIQGEISNFTPHSSGHLYFNLKDSGATLLAVMFRADASMLKVMPKAGDQVIVKGDLNVYPQNGKYQLIVRELSFVGLGELLLKLEQLKVKLNKMGWFKPERKKPLPKFPKRIGVVTSPTGAAIHDILNVLGRRFSGFNLILNPVKVQGEGSAKEIADAIDYFNKTELVDVMIVGRGGGSIEDLWAFNEEIVAQAIYNSRIPVISAVGHETDHCIADYVADVRAPTPSAAAEIVIAEKAHQLTFLFNTQRRLQQTISLLLKQDRTRLSVITRQPLFLSHRNLLGPWMQRCDEIRNNLDHYMTQKLQNLRRSLVGIKRHTEALKPETQILHFRQKLGYWQKGIDSAMMTNISQSRHRFNADLAKKAVDRLWIQQISLKNERLNKVISTLHAIDPRNLLAKGYSILFSEKDNSIISTVSMLEKRQDARLLLSDGEALITIKDINPK